MLVVTFRPLLKDRQNSVFAGVGDEIEEFKFVGINGGHI